MDVLFLCKHGKSLNSHLSTLYCSIIRTQNTDYFTVNGLRTCCASRRPHRQICREICQANEHARCLGCRAECPTLKNLVVWCQPRQIKAILLFYQEVNVLSPDFFPYRCYVGKARLNNAVEALKRAEPDAKVRVSFTPYMIDPQTRPEGEGYLAYNKRRWGSDGWTTSLKRYILRYYHEATIGARIDYRGGVRVPRTSASRGNRVIVLTCLGSMCSDKTNEKCGTFNV